MIAQSPESLAKELNQIASSIGSSIIPTFLEQAKTAIVADTRTNFRTSSGPDGTPWKGLAIPRARGGDKLLMDKGILRGSVVSDSKGGFGKGHIERITGNTLVMGTSQPYAVTQQEGDTIVPKAAKALAIPRTKEAERAESPRNFPRPLFVLWKNGAKSGVLAEYRIANRAKRKEVQALQRQSRAATKRGALKAAKKLEKQALSLARKYKAKPRKGRNGQPDTKPITIQFALVKSVTIPPRPFLGFGPRLETKLNKIMTRLVRQQFLKQPTAGA